MFRTTNRPSNTGDKLRAFSTLNARLLHPLVGRTRVQTHWNCTEPAPQYVKLLLSEK